MTLLGAAGCGDPCGDYCTSAIDRLIECKILKDTPGARSSEIDSCRAATSQGQADAQSCKTAQAGFETYTCGDLYVQFCGSPDPNVICTEPVVCDDQLECTTDLCPADALPTHTPREAGVPCTYGYCDGAGKCVQCVADSTCPITGKEPCVIPACIDHVCSQMQAPMGTSCSDGDACTLGDTCLNGECKSGAKVVCTPADDCHSAGLCQPSGACTTPLLCSGSAVCQGGSCAAGACAKALSFSSAATVAQLLGPDEIVTADLDGDHDLDLAVIEAAGDVMVARTIANQGNGSYVARNNYVLGSIQVGTSGGRLLARDLDGDGLVDLAGVLLTTGSLVVLHNQGLGVLADPVTYSVEQLAGRLDAADMNGDGLVDLVVQRNSESDVVVLPNLGNGAFGAAAVIPTGSYDGGMAIADVDGDGHPDIVACDNPSSTASVLHNQGDGTFAAPVPYPAGTKPEDVRAGDLDGDGRPDLVILNLTAGQASVLLNNGDGTFGAPANVPLTSGGSRSDLVDMDGDGDLDLLVLYGDEVQLFRNESGSLTYTQQAWLQLSSYGFATGDLDGNGYPDLVGYNINLSDVKVVYTSCGP
ncbi:MAG: VCBS repeat-containing protein [Polyangiaceae bacterium]